MIKRFGLFKVMLVILALLSAIFITGCQSQKSTETEEPAKSEEVTKTEPAKPWKLGSILALQGPIAAIDEFTRAGMEAAIKEINDAGGIHGRPVELVVEDDQANPTVAVSAARKLTEDEEIMGVIGPSFTTFSLATIPVFEEVEIPNMALGAGIQIIDPLKKWVFKVPLTDIIIAKQMFNFFKEKGITKIAVLHQDDASGESGRANMEKLAKDYGIQIVATEKFSGTATDMRSQLLRIKRTDAKAVSLWAGAEPVAMIAKNRKELEMNQMFVSAHTGVGKHFLEVAGEAGEGMYFYANSVFAAEQLDANDHVKQLFDKLKPQVSKGIDGFLANGYDSVMMIAEAIKRAGPEATRSTIRDQLETIKDYPLLLGTFTYGPDDHDGLSEDSVIRIIVKDGSFWPDK